MDKIKGLKEYVSRKEFKDVLEIPSNYSIEYDILAQGEYNINYTFRHPKTNQKLVLRVNTASQMHLANQIGYEYQTLTDLQHSGCTPLAFFADGSLEHLDYGIMVMEFLEGRSLDYRTDLTLAAECLSQIHSQPVPKNTHLLSPDDPIQAVLDECEAMFCQYETSPLGNDSIKKKIRHMLELAKNKAGESDGYTGYRCCINTELNSSNFLINGPGKSNYLIDWEKPLFGEPAQDLGHFLAPTTTFFRTDIILDTEAVNQFITHYERSAGSHFSIKGIRERTRLFIPVTCLRGITWSAMAWIEYQDPGRLIRNEYTYKKLEDYLKYAFLDYLEKNYLN